MIDEKKFMEFITALEDAGAEYVSFDDLRKFVDEFPKIGGWIPCSERLPEEKINPVTNDFYEYQVTFKSDKVTDVRHYKFGRGHWRNCGQNVDKYVTAWREPLEAYRG
ncbi:DUF551 domain-containing protein [Lachnospiraceae bacterium]|jgi:hypothetical protein|nr:DUF551 domain-containing protein [Lachnospiraceae bacterium]